MWHARAVKFRHHCLGNPFWVGVRKDHLSLGVVAFQATGDMEVLLEMVLEREVQERCPGRGQLHAGGQTALDERKVAGRQMPIQIGNERPHLLAVGHIEFRWVEARPGHHDHPQFGDTRLGERVGAKDAAYQRRAHARATDGHDVGLAPVVIAKLGAQLIPAAELGWVPYPKVRVCDETGEVVTEKSLTPAMELGITDRVWDISDLLELTDLYLEERRRAATTSTDLVIRMDEAEALNAFCVYSYSSTQHH